MNTTRVIPIARRTNATSRRRRKRKKLPDGRSRRRPRPGATMMAGGAVVKGLGSYAAVTVVRHFERKPMDWKLELISVPVSDVDRAKAFYTEQAGFNADHD